MLKCLLVTLLFMSTFTVLAQSTKEVNWEFSSIKLSDKTYEVHLTARINGDWHLYSQNAGVTGPVPTTFTFTKNALLSLDGKTKEIGKVIKKKEEAWGGVVNYYEKTVDFVQVVRVKATAKTNLAGTVEFMVCNDEKCLPPAEMYFSIKVGG